MAATDTALQPADYALLIDAPQTDAPAFVDSSAVTGAEGGVVDSRHVHLLRHVPLPYPASVGGCWYCDWCSRSWRGAALHCVDCRFDLCPDCAEQRYDGAQAEEGEANALTAVSAGIAVPFAAHEHALQEWMGEVGQCCVCGVGLHGLNPWWGRHYRCSLDKRCNYKLCARCFDDPAPPPTPAVAFTAALGVPFAACTAALLDIRLQQLLQADDELRAVRTREEAVSRPPSSRPTELQRRCAASQWQLLQALLTAVLWSASAGARAEYDRCQRLMFTRWHPPQPPDVLRRQEALAAQLWDKMQREMVHEPRHQHARLHTAIESVACAVCGLRWTWQLYQCVDPDCSYTQCARCTLFPHLPPALSFSDVFPSLDDGSRSPRVVNATILATVNSLLDAARRSTLVRSRRGLVRVNGYEADGRPSVPDEADLSSADALQLSEMDEQQLAREHALRNWTLREAMRRAEQYYFTNPFQIDDRKARKQWLIIRLRGVSHAEMAERGGRQAVQNQLRQEWTEAHPTGTGNSESETGRQCVVQ